MPKNHRQNSNFQIAHFLAGSCHTPDGAYAMLCDLKEEREQAIEHYNVSILRGRAKRLRLNDLLKNADEPTRLEAEAELLEMDNGESFGKVLFDAAMDELQFINNCIEKLKPHRLYKDLPDAEAFEAAQQEEWKLELIFRAENSLATVGLVPTDHFSTMRMHPEFETAILPRIQEMQDALKIGGLLEMQGRLNAPSGYLEGIDHG